MHLYLLRCLLTTKHALRSCVDLWSTVSTLTLGFVKVKWQKMMSGMRIQRPLSPLLRFFALIKQCFLLKLFTKLLGTCLYAVWSTQVKVSLFTIDGCTVWILPQAYLYFVFELQSSNFASAMLLPFLFHSVLYKKRKILFFTEKLAYKWIIMQENGATANRSSFAFSLGVISHNLFWGWIKFRNG